uniref:Uncharacterized protein n=1 Tax=Fundulus heteroclitus TaxID=8078 RepID=A0A3Q2PIL1_FUNHE
LLLSLDEQESVGEMFHVSDVSPYKHICITGVIAVVIFVVLAGLAVTARYLYRRKDTSRSQERSAVKRDDGPDFPFNNQTDPQNLSTENPKEYFI